MSTTTLAQFFFETFMVIVLSYMIYRENDLIKFERRLWKIMKRFPKACKMEYREWKEKKKAPIIPISSNIYH